MTAVTIVGGVSDPGDVTTISGVSIIHTGVTLVDYNSGPSGPVYFLSVTTSTDTETNSIVVDSSGNIDVFGYNITGFGGLAAQLTSSGTKSLFKGVYTGDFVTRGSIDSSDNIYITEKIVTGLCTFNSAIIKANTSFGVVASTTINLGGSISNVYAATADSSGNVWVASDDTILGYLIKLNSTLSAGSNYVAYNTGSITVNPTTISLTSSGNLIVGEVLYDYTLCSCSGSPAPIVQSITTSGVLNWTQKPNLAGYGAVKALAVDSSGNIYFTVNSQNLLIKLNSSGAVQWTNNAKLYAAILYFLSIAVDSSGNVYCIGISSVYAGTLEIIKVNSAGVIQFSNKLSVTSGGTLNVSNSSITVKNGAMYIATTTFPPVGGGKATVLKVPTDGTLTQTIVVGSITYSYAPSGVTSSDFAIAGSLTTSYPFNSATASGLITYTPTISDVTATTAVTTL